MKRLAAYSCRRTYFFTWTQPVVCILHGLCLGASQTIPEDKKPHCQAQNSPSHLFISAATTLYNLLPSPEGYLQNISCLDASCSRIVLLFMLLSCCPFTAKTTRNVFVKGSLLSCHSKERRLQNINKFMKHISKKIKPTKVNEYSFTLVGSLLNPLLVQVLQEKWL